MFSSILPAAALVAVASAAFDPLSKNNVATYWGQGPNQQRLVEFCKGTQYDIINVGFVNVFPDQGKGGFPGSNFGNQCGSEVFQNANGVNTQLLSNCPYIEQDVIECQQTYGKKVFLSLGGAAPGNYYLESIQSARNFANFLWAAFGPVSASKPDVPRPWGDATVDGFDFDIESLIKTPPAKPKNYKRAFYADMITRLRILYDTDTSKKYYISGAPQCIVPDEHLSEVMANAWFDFLFVQFYNTEICSARAGIMAINGKGDTDISYLQWVADVAARSKNPNLRVSIGLPASKKASGLAKYWLNPTEAQMLVKKFYKQKLFGGVMLWEATYAANNKVCSKDYGTWMKNILLGQAAGKDIKTTCPSKREVSEYGEEPESYEDVPEISSSSSCTSTMTMTRSKSSVPNAPIYTMPGNYTTKPSNPTSSSVSTYSSSESYAVSTSQSSAVTAPVPTEYPTEPAPSTPASYPAPPEETSPVHSSPASPEQSGPASSYPASPESPLPTSGTCGEVTVTVKETSTFYVTATNGASDEDTTTTISTTSTSTTWTTTTVYPSSSASGSAPGEDVTSLTTIQSTSTIYDTHTQYMTRPTSEAAPAGGASPSSPASPVESSPSEYENSPIGGEGDSYSSAPAAPAYSSHGHQHGHGGHAHGGNGPHSTTTITNIVTVIPVPATETNGSPARPTEAPSVPYPYGPGAGGNSTAPGTASAAPSAPSASAPVMSGYPVPQQTGGAATVGSSVVLMTLAAGLAVMVL